MRNSTKSYWPWLLALLLGGTVLACSGLCVVGIGLSLAANWAQQRALIAPPDIIAEYDVRYGTGGGEPLLMDIARPKVGNGPHPAVVCIHGGGWRGGDKVAYRQFIHLLAQRGFVAVSVRYRFAPTHRFPAQLEDVKSAVRYLRANADSLEVDPDRIGATGGSAGGHLALLLGTTKESDGLEGIGNAGHSSAVQAVASLVGPTDLTAEFPPVVQTMLHDFVGGENHEALRSASPIHYLGSSDAPILLVYGTKDPLVPYSQATAMLAACKKKGISAQLITIEGGGHGSGGNPRDWTQANNQIVEFFEEQLKKSN